MNRDERSEISVSNSRMLGKLSAEGCGRSPVAGTRPSIRTPGWGRNIDPEDHVGLLSPSRFLIGARPSRRLTTGGMSPLGRAAPRGACPNSGLCHGVVSARGGECPAHPLVDRPGAGSRVRTGWLGVGERETAGDVGPGPKRDPTPASRGDARAKVAGGRVMFLCASLRTALARDHRLPRCSRPHRNR
jgi:hypothetical protein